VQAVRLEQPRQTSVGYAERVPVSAFIARRLGASKRSIVTAASSSSTSPRG
jgi:hypothetical protein